MRFCSMATNRLVVFFPALASQPPPTLDAGHRAQKTYVTLNRYTLVTL